MRCKNSTQHHLFIIPFYLVFSIAIVSCNTDNCLKSTGNSISIIRELTTFNEIEINDVFTVYISHDSVSWIQIDGGEKLIPEIETNVLNKRLVISNNNSCNWLREYSRIKLVIYSDSINCLEVNGESDIFSIDTIKSNQLNIGVSSGIASIMLYLNCKSYNFSLKGGTGDYTFSGKVGVACEYLMGTGHFNADKLETGYTFITSNTTGKCFIMATKEISAKIYSSGNIYYSGNPPLVHSTVTGSGKLINIE